MRIVTRGASSAPKTFVLRGWKTYHIPIRVLPIFRHLHQPLNIMRVRPDFTRQILGELERPVNRVEQVVFRAARAIRGYGILRVSYYRQLIVSMHGELPVLMLIK